MFLGLTSAPMPKACIYCLNNLRMVKCGPVEGLEAVGMYWPRDFLVYVFIDMTYGWIECFL